MKTSTLPEKARAVGLLRLREVRRRATALLDQQMWCWGQDVRRPEGNALLAHGMQRHRAPAGGKGGTAYAAQPAPGVQVVLWGFGLFYGAAGRGGLYLARYSFNPVWTPVAELTLPLWEPAQLPPLAAAATEEQRANLGALLSAALHWIGVYERWAVAVLGIAYRRRCVAAWPRPVVAAEAMAAEWDALADCCRAVFPEVALAPDAAGTFPMNERSGR